MKHLLLKIALAGFLGYGTVFYVAPVFVPLPERFEQGPPQGLVFLSRDGEPIRRKLDGDLRAEEPATFGEFPPVLVEATLAAEDSRFFRHNGVDFPGTLRAARDALIHRRFVSGASTITQQTIKLYSPPRERNLRTKLIEILSARKLEMFAGKEEILAAYLNHLPYGNQFTGARAAARGYFGKPLADLSLAEAALLAGLPNKPSRLNPWRNRNGARARQHWILERMREEGYISEAEFAGALVATLRFLPGPSQTFHGPHFVELVERLEEEKVSDARADRIPLVTTLDLELQDFVESAVTAELSRLAQQANEADDLQAAVVVIDNATGDVLSLTGSRSFFHSRSGQINGAWTPRSAGSTLKPFTYLLAFERGYHAASVLADTPIEYVTSTGTYQPVNFDRRFSGPVPIRRALANSLNVPAVKLLDRIGGPGLLHETLSRDLGFSSLDREPGEYGLGLTLGNAEVRLLELANAYACLARLGEHRPFRIVRPATPEGGDAANRKAAQTGRRVFDRSATWLIADILSDDRARVEAFGLGSALDLPFRAAVKTGTSTDFRDNWTLGFTPGFTVGVWVGRFDNRPLNRISGAIGAAPIFHRVLTHLHRDREPSWFERPDGAVLVEVDRLIGKRPPSDLELSEARLVREVFVSGNLPEPASSSDYGSDGRTLLPIEYHHWWQGGGHDLSAIAALRSLAPDAPAPRFRIVSPLEGTVAFLDPDLPGNGARFPLEVAGSGSEEIEWESRSLRIEQEGETSWLLLEPGRHQVVAVDRKTGRSVSTHLSVRSL